MNKNILSIKDLKLTYHTLKNETLAVTDFNLDIKNEEFVSLVGPSGCGKTTVLSMIAGLIKPSGGKIIFDSHEVVGINTDIGYMFQRDNLFEWISVYENLVFALKIQKKLNENTKAFVLDLAEKYGLKDFLSHYPNQLSGGMRQRVSLIRTLATDPKLLLLDEPFSALDYQTRINVQDIVHDIIKREKKSAILVTHDISEAITMSNRVVVMTKRPGTIKSEKIIDFGDCDRPFLRRSQPNFQEYFNYIWGEMKDD